MPRRNGDQGVSGWPIAPYPSAPSVVERMARVEERVDNLVDRFDGFVRSMRFAVTIGVAAGGRPAP